MKESFVPLYDEDKLIKYNSFEERYEKNKEDLIAIGNLIESLQNYIYSINISCVSEEELYFNKRQAAKRIIEIMSEISSNKYIHPEYLSIMAQSNFILVNLSASWKFYSELLRQPGIIDNDWKKNTDFYSGEQEHVVKIIHNMCLISRLMGKDDNILYLKDKYKYLFQLEENRYRRLIEDNPRLKESFQKECKELTNVDEINIFYYDNSLDSSIFMDDSSMLKAIYEDAKRNNESCDIMIDGSLKIENYADFILLREMDSLLLGDDAVIKIQIDDNLQDETSSIQVNDKFLEQGYEKVEIFGRNVDVPGAIFIRQYFNIVGEIKEKYDELNLRIQKQINECRAEADGGWAKIQTNFWMDSENDGAFIIDLLELINYASYDVCPDGDIAEYYGNKSNAYCELEKLRKILVNEAREISNAYDRNYQVGSKLAFDKAASQIKGMRYGIITNSVIDLLAYEAVANLSIKSQANKANQQYEKELKQLAKSVSDIYKQNLLSLMYEQYVPAAKQIIKDWADEVLRRRIGYEIKYGNKIYGEIGNYDVEKSQKICDEIRSSDKSNVKESKLKDAFMTCPFNESVYLKIAQFGLMSKNIYAYARILGGKQLSDKIKKATFDINENELSNITEIKKRIAFMADEFDSEDKILTEVYRPYIQKIQNKLSYLNNVAEGNIAIKNYVINDLDIKDIEKFVSMTEEDIKEKVSKSIEDNITRKMWDTVVYNKLLPANDVFKDYMGDYAFLCESYIQRLFEVVGCYWHRIKDTKQKIQKKKMEYSEKVNQLSIEIEKKNLELSSLGIFKFKEKKEIKVQIEKVHIEIENLNSEIKNLCFKWE